MVTGLLRLSEGDKSYQGVRTGTTREALLDGQCHTGLWTTLLLRWTVTQVSLRDVARSQEQFIQLNLTFNCTAHRVMLSAFNTLPESEAGTGHWFTPSIIQVSREYPHFLLRAHLHHRANNAHTACHRFNADNNGAYDVISHSIKATMFIGS